MSNWMNKALELESQVNMLRKEIEILSLSNFDKVKEFNSIFNKEPDPTTPSIPSDEKIILRMKLIAEEFQEVINEFGYDISVTLTPMRDKSIKLHKIAKELADLLVVVYGAAAAFGINIDEVFNVVHKSNMSKLDENGIPIYREDGKVLKSRNYIEPNIKQVLDEGL